MKRGEVIVRVWSGAIGPLYLVRAAEIIVK